MDTLETLAQRIETTQSLRSVVRTMRALSAASIAQYDGAVGSMRQYMRTIEMGLRVVMRSGEAHARGPDAARGPVMAIVFGSDHSLCGVFNERIIRTAIEEQYSSGRQDWFWLAVGTRAAYTLEAAGILVRQTIELPGTASGLVDTAHRLLVAIDDWRARDEVSRVLLFHNRRREETAMSHRLQLWPLDPHWLELLARRPWRSRSIPVFTMGAPELFAAFTREHLFANIFRSGAESLASEHATRLAAMQYALQNIEDHLAEMTSDFRRKRQEKITTELMDIVAGFETLRKV
jgi:F-type H+-transporting ATPase subunit gamma